MSIAWVWVFFLYFQILFYVQYLVLDMRQFLIIWKEMRYKKYYAMHTIRVETQWINNKIWRYYLCRNYRTAGENGVFVKMPIKCLL